MRLTALLALALVICVAAPGGASDVEMWYTGTTTTAVGSSSGVSVISSPNSGSPTWYCTFYIFGNYYPNNVDYVPSAGNWLNYVTCDGVMFTPAAVVPANLVGPGNAPGGCGPVPTDSTRQTGYVTLYGVVPPGYHDCTISCNLTISTGCFDEELIAFSYAPMTYVTPGLTIIPYPNY